MPVNNVFVLCGHTIAFGNAAIYEVNLQHAVSLHRCVNFIAFQIPIYTSNMYFSCERERIPSFA